MANRGASDETAPYDGPAGGWGSFEGVTRIFGAEGSTSAAIETPAGQNESHGFARISCSGTQPADHHPFESCENGAETTLWELITRRCTPGSFEKRMAPELKGWKEYDEQTMRRCFTLAARSAREGGYPFAAIVTQKTTTIAEAINRVSQDRDVTRHAEAVALTEAQRTLGCTSLDDCTLYANVEPCALCSYAIRETRVARVVYGLSSPVMGGHSRWDILGDELLSSRMPEVFAPPPEIVAHFMSDEAAVAFRRAAPMAWADVRSRECFRCGEDLRGRRPDLERGRKRRRRGATEKAMRFLRLRVFDRFGR